MREIVVDEIAHATVLDLFMNVSAQIGLMSLDCYLRILAEAFLDVRRILAACDKDPYHVQLREAHEEIEETLSMVEALLALV